ncbi:CDGSH iron-sulfur domain-containing protein [Sulfidibacter corallicola]|uniref:CDGSH iron-sulfur domain-containing protein n=1 Tax=Sulfidibacter corallicola TaxID=2818388 RepID=A0A8A4TTD6_SULCO|nr:CDGSH iron-sulfur domain-containing protein [Sulfidibacter corallicola]QTD52753.1 CDGSH iron-sulfur domain-containing protein [Sulfidibacter corallicola]
MPEKPIVAQKGPMSMQLEAGKTYWWCRCGRSKTQPMCDGSHEGTGIEPMEYTARIARNFRFCACKATKKPPFCDGSHLDL